MPNSQNIRGSMGKKSQGGMPNKMGPMSGMGTDYDDYDNFQNKNWG